MCRAALWNRTGSRRRGSTLIRMIWVRNKWSQQVFAVSRTVYGIVSDFPHCRS